MKTPARRRPALAAVALAALAAVPMALAACSSPYGTASAAPPPPTTTTIEGADTPALTKASDLRAKLTYLMVEHAYVLGRAVLEQVKPAGFSSDAATATDASARDISDLLGQALGSAFSAQFAGLWSGRAAAFEAYASARASGNAGAATAALSQLASNASSLATLIHTSDKFLEVHTVSNPPTGIGDELTTINTSYQAFVDAAATNDLSTYPKLVTAAEAMPHTAEMLAAAIAKLAPTTYPGTAFGTAANLRSSLTELAIEHIELAASAAGATSTGKDAAPQVAALRANTSELHNAFAAIYDDATAGRFDDLWSAQVDTYLAYAKARLTGDAVATSTAETQLDRLAQGFGQFLNTTTAGKVPTDAPIGAQVKAVEAVIDGAATSASDETSRIRAAAGAVPGWTAKLAEAVAEQFPTRYLP